MSAFFHSFSSLFLVLSLSADTFVSGLAYGSEKIHIPPLSMAAASSVCTAVLGLSVMFGSAVSMVIAPNFSSLISFALLLLLGLAKLFESIICHKLEIISRRSGDVCLKFMNFNLLIKVYCDSAKADTDFSGHISVKEACLLALALSFDGLGAGIGIGLGEFSIFHLMVFSLIINYFCLWLGCKAGKRLAAKFSSKLSWLSGAVLILLAFIRL